MKPKKRPVALWLIALIVLVAVAFVADICLGSVAIPFDEVLSALFGGETSKESWGIIIRDIRLPKALTALVAGAALSIAGLQMQTLFRNPLAGPFVLGISSGASLGVAVLVMAGSALSVGFLNPANISGAWGQVIASVAGSFAVLSLVMLVAIRVKDSVTLLIVGLMFGSLTAAVVSVLQHFSSPELVDAYVIWTFGSLKGVDWSHLAVLTPIFAMGLLFSFALHKSFNALLLGEDYAESLGVSVRRTRMLTIVSTSLLAGSVTAFCGPIAFIGLAVPHLVRALFGSAKHRLLLPACLLGGAALMLICDIISEMPGLDQTLPVNSVTALFGAPVVIAVILRNRNLNHSF